MARPRKYPGGVARACCQVGVRVEASDRAVAQDLGVHKESLRNWVRQAEAESGRRRDLLTSEERDELRRLRKEVAELRRANAILQDASVYFAQELDSNRRR